MQRPTRRPALRVVALVLIAASCAVPAPGLAGTARLRWSTTEPEGLQVSYGPEPEHVGELHLPVRGGNRGVIVTVHGGGFSGGYPGMVHEWFGPVVRQTERGFALFNIGYRLTSADGNHFPAAVHDASAAVAWIREHGRSHGVNPNTVIIAGHSAGGTVAALVGTGSNSDPNGPLGHVARVDGWLSWAGIYDLHGTERGIDGVARDWLGPNAADRRWRDAASATRHVDSTDPPGFVVHGDLDDVVPVEQMTSLVLAAGRAGVTKGLLWDRVDSGSRACRGHLPQCGMNASFLDVWMDHVVAGTL